MATAGHNSGSKLIVRLHPSDNVVTARLDILGNTRIDEEQLSSSCPIPSGHKSVSYTHLTLPTSFLV